MQDYHETAAQPTPTNDAIVHQSVNKISLLVGFIVAIAMLIDGRTVTISVLAGVGFYLFVAILLITLPFLTQILIAWMREVTIRRYNELPYKGIEGVTQRVEVIEHPQIEHSPIVDPVRLPEPARFVPPVPPTSSNVRVDAANFINQLFDSNGRPLPNKITKNKGQIQHASPTPEAVEYLMALGIVKRGEGKQLYYNRDMYDGFPTLRDAINAIRTGVRRPSYQEGKGRVSGVAQ